MSPSPTLPNPWKEQYRDASNLNARVRLHALFSTNHYGWQPWVFDQLALPPECCILELGCGPGMLWLENRERIPPGWRITLSDFSPGMAAQAQVNLGRSNPRYAFGVIDAQALPFPASSFDAVIANHMLYHVPNRLQALSEMRRVLRPGGRLVASTVGQAHLRELFMIVCAFDPSARPVTHMPSDPFTLENGCAQIEAYFTEVSLRRYADTLHVTQAAPLADYVLSGMMGVDKQRGAELHAWMERELARQGGMIHITKDSGLFVAVRDAQD